jgi:hypothetical protein
VQAVGANVDRADAEVGPVVGDLMDLWFLED